LLHLCFLLLYAPLTALLGAAIVYSFYACCAVLSVMGCNKRSMSGTLPGYLHSAQTTTQITNYMKTVEEIQMI